MTARSSLRPAVQAATTLRRMGGVLDEPVARFVEELVPVLDHLAGQLASVSRDKLPRDVAQEAYNLAAAFVATDGRFTDDELQAFLDAFAPRFPTLLAFTPAQVRSTGMLDGKDQWLGEPSILFDILVRADAARGTSWSWRYYERAMALAHAVCATDAVPSSAELAALDRFRSLLLRTMDTAGVARPGSTRPGGTDRAGGPTDAPDEPPLPPARPLEELLDELDALVGLEPVKAEVKLVANLLQVQNLRRERGLPVVESSRHLVFTGNPGTGKTTVARLLAQIYRTLGVVEKGQLVETDRSGLVAGYVGQTAIKVRQVVESALGGVLLIDEAYALARGSERGGDFGIEAIDTLVKMMEDHRDDLVVIAAGYTDEMEVFISSNPGLRSRFPKTIHFPDFDTDELVAIFVSMCERNGYGCPPDTVAAVRAWLGAVPRTKGFGNARLARNLFEAALAHHATRVVGIEEPTDEDLSVLLPEDVR